MERFSAFLFLTYFIELFSDLLMNGEVDEGDEVIVEEVSFVLFAVLAEINYTRLIKYDSSRLSTSATLHIDSTRLVMQRICELRLSSLKISERGSLSLDCLHLAMSEARVSLYCFKLLRKLFTFTDSV
jgi:hypothetical protein